MAVRHPLRILLAEDNGVNQKLALRLLEQMGYRADLASNGREAVDSVARQAYDLLLMDVRMPEMDGLDATREIVSRWPAGAAPAYRRDDRQRPQRRPPAMPGRGHGRALEQAAAGGRPGGRAGRHPRTQRRMNLPRINADTFEALQANAGADFVVTLVEAFAEEAPQLIAALREARAAGRRRRLRERRPHAEGQWRRLRCHPAGRDGAPPRMAGCVGCKRGRR